MFIPVLSIYATLLAVYKLPELLQTELEKQRCSADPSSCRLTPWIYGVVICTFGSIIIVLILAVVLNQRFRGSANRPLSDLKDSVNDIPTNLIRLSPLEKEREVGEKSGSEFGNKQETSPCGTGDIVIREQGIVVAHADDDGDESVYEDLPSIVAQYPPLARTSTNIYLENIIPRSKKPAARARDISDDEYSEIRDSSKSRSVHWDSGCGTFDILPDPHPVLLL